MPDRPQVLKTAGERWNALLEAADRRVSTIECWNVSGRVSRATGLVLEATCLRLAVGAACKIELSAGGRHWANAEVVGFHGNTLYLMPQAEITGLPPGARVVPIEPSVQSKLNLPRQRIDHVGPPPVLSQHLPVDD